MTSYRLDSGGLIDRNKTIRFRFDGTSRKGFVGDTVASALLASGQQLFGRSFKYHRPRGVVAAGSEEPNALITIDRDGIREPNTRASMAEIFAGLEGESQNRWPSLKLDLMAINQLGGTLFQAGFYYKTFMGPTRKAWRVYEHFIRRAAGLGQAGLRKDNDRYDQINAFADVLVVGGGFAGLVAASIAADKGAKVVIVDENAGFGGWHRGDPSAQEEIDRLVGELHAADNVTILPRTTCFGVYDDGTYGLVERVSGHLPQAEPFMPVERLYVLRAKHAIYACGAIERPLVFPDNDRPGVMLADSIRAYAQRYAVAAGKKVCLFGNNDGLYDTLGALTEAGVSVCAVVDSRSEISEKAMETVSVSGAESLTGHAITDVKGHFGVTQVRIATFDADKGTVTGNDRSLDCDCLGMSGGWTPTIHLTSQMGGPPQWDDEMGAVLPGESNGSWTVCGSMAGYLDKNQVLESGEKAAETALRALGMSRGRKSLAPSERVNTLNLKPLWRVRGAKGKALVDFQHDVTADDIQLAYQEGYLSVEHLKRYTTLGMATDQGKLSNINGLALMAEARSEPIPQVGTTRFRPPYTPVSYGAIAADVRGHHFKPTRRTPMHHWHMENGAQMMDAGLWKRPRIYPRGDESVEQAYVREASQVRHYIGMVDVSTLGKIAVQGPDSTEFLNRVYSNGFAKLPVGKARYGLMLREDGIVYDDGTTWRLGEQEYFMTTTTGHAAGVMENLEQYLALHWPDLRVSVTSVTDQWAGVAVAGPRCRGLLETAVPDVDWSNEAFPFMHIRHGHTKSGIPVMICRLSFSGELAFELYCGSRFGAKLWEELFAVGKPLACTPYGLEALGTLRIEKGHVTHSELNGRTTAEMVGLGKMVSTKKPSVGSAMVDRPAFVDAQRQQMVGLQSLNGNPIRIGAHVVRGDDPKKPGISIGHVTSCAFSPVKKAYVALALVDNGRALEGETVYAADPLRDSHGPAIVIEPVMYDKEGEKLHG